LLNAGQFKTEPGSGKGRCRRPSAAIGRACRSTGLQHRKQNAKAAADPKRNTTALIRQRSIKVRAVDRATGVVSHELGSIEAAACRRAGPEHQASRRCMALARRAGVYAAVLSFLCPADRRREMLASRVFMYNRESLWIGVNLGITD